MAMHMCRTIIRQISSTSSKGGLIGDLGANTCLAGGGARRQGAHRYCHSSSSSKNQGRCYDEKEERKPEELKMKMGVEVARKELDDELRKRIQLQKRRKWFWNWFWQMTESAERFTLQKTESSERVAVRYIYEDLLSLAKSGVEEANPVRIDVDWLLDTGATAHMCKNRSDFKTYRKITDPRHLVIMGNNMPSKVIGVGKVELKFTSGKTVTLCEVLHVPEITDNLMCGNCLNKAGFKFVFEYDSLVISKNNDFVGNGYSCKGMIKMNVNKVE